MIPARWPVSSVDHEDKRTGLSSSGNERRPRNELLHQPNVRCRSRERAAPELLWEDHSDEPSNRNVYRLPKRFAHNKWYGLTDESGLFLTSFFRHSKPR